MSALTYKKNDDIESGSLDKMTVYQDCIRGFNASPINPRQCRKLLSKLVRLISNGENFPTDESTQLFFSITKLFQHKDASLRQMVYLAVKELCSSANDTIFLTSSIMKDVQGPNEMIYKPNAIRALVRIIDADTVQAIERLMKTAIVDKHAGISSAALVSSYHLMPISKEVVRRWANEAQETILTQKKFPQSSMDPRYSAGVSTMTQYHALGLLYHLRSHDKMALMKMIQQFSSDNGIRNANAIVMLIRYIAKIIDDDPNLRSGLFQYLEGWLRHRSDIVNLEAAKTILNMNNISETESSNAINVLQSFLGSPRQVSKFAAIRILNKFAMSKPQAVRACNAEIETLIGDSSRSIATFAITTLLKTGTEASVDRLVDRISDFMNEISDEFKIVVIDAVRSLALKFPHKFNTMLPFLANTLRNEGGLKFKTAVVEALFDMIRYIPESRDAALSHLCEFIEDCEFTELVVRILHLLGSEGPKTSEPTMYIRYIYNRVVLENAIIRAAAVTSLAKFALVDDKSVQNSIKVLLTRCLDDDTDEVRDRAALSLRLLDMEPKVAASYVAPTAKYSLAQLEHKLAIYVSGEGDLEKPFDITQVALITDEEARAQDLKQKTQSTEPSKKQKRAQENEQKKPHEKDMERELQAEKYAQALAAIPEIAEYGQLLKSSEPVELSESETEYVVVAIKHMFANHFVIQYDVKNTLEDTVLDNVYVENDDGEFGDADFTIPIDRLECNNTGSVYVSYSRESSMVVTTMENILKFVTKEIDPSTGVPQADGFDDEYRLEDLNVLIGDYMTPAYIGDFATQFEQLPNKSESSFKLGNISIVKAIEDITNVCCMSALEGTDMPLSETSHTLKLCGRTVGKEIATCQVKMVHSAKNGTVIKVTAKSEDEEVTEMIVESIGSLSS